MSPSFRTVVLLNLNVANESVIVSELNDILAVGNEISVSKYWRLLHFVGCVLLLNEIY